MSSRVAHVARFGNRSGAHSLLDWSGGDKGAFEQILSYTDRPPDLSLDEFPEVRAGYPAGDFYTFQVTVADREAHRPGMVRTTALLLPRTDLGEVSITQVFGRLSALDDITVIEVEALASTGSPPKSAGSGALTDALVTERRAIWLGDGFESALERVWDALPLDDRLQTTFGTAAHPASVSVPCEEGGLVALVTAGRYSQRWDWPRVGADHAGPATSEGQAFLDAQSSVHSLAKDLVGRPARMAQTRMLLAASARLNEIDQLSHESLRALAQLVCVLSPSKALGKATKSAVAEALRRTTPAASYADAVGLRNVDWGALTNGRPTTELTEAWAHAVWSDPSRTDDLVSVVVAPQNADNPVAVEIGTLLAAEVEADTAQISAHLDPLVVRTEARAVTDWLLEHSTAPDLDPLLAAAGRSQLQPWMSDYALERKLPLTHAATVQSGDAVADWREQMTLPFNQAAFDELTDRLGGEAVVAAALAGPEAAIVAQAAATIARDPKLLPNDAAASEAGRRLWSESIQAGAEPWAHLEPAPAAKGVFAALLDGATIDQTLLRAIADSSEASLFAQPRRSELWSLLPSELRSSFLAATAPDAAADVASGGALPEPELQRTLLDLGVFGAISLRAQEQGLALLERLPSAGPSHASAFIRLSPLDKSIAGRFGELVRRRGWKAVARELMDAEKGRPDLRAATDRVESLLGVRAKLKRSVGVGRTSELVLSEAEVRSVAIELLSELYPRGPEDRSLWSRAGGDESVLPLRDSGRERWQAAMDALRAGRRGTPKLEELLNNAASDHPLNGELRALTSAFERQNRD